MSDDFIELDREFAELSDYASSSDDIDISEAFRIGKTLSWDSLIPEYRVIILAEAGTGKTWEIRQTTKNLRADGRHAFFLRLEHVSDGLESAFEVGSFDEFEQWLASDEEGWLFLDSVDEARLLDPKDFERAIRKFSVELKAALQRTHIYITSRSSGWRPYTDLQLCKDKLPYQPPRVREAPGEGEESSQENESEDSATDESTTETASSANGENALFRLLTLKALSSAQIKTFVEAKGVEDGEVFLEEIERKDAWAFTSRPLDLEDLIDFWKVEGRVAERSELMRFNIERKLSEVDPDREQARPVAPSKLFEGAKRLAAAVTLLQESAIKIPDAKANTEGIDAKKVLPKWDETERTALLTRPIFDEALYGTVRFHHRSVREYLTAEWLYELATNGNSRKQVEALCFRTQYGLPVVVPTLRPVLPWLALRDDKILERLLTIAPEVLLEGGDPTQIPLDKRRELLRAVCADLASGTSGRSVLDHTAVQRFAKADIADDIKALLKTHREHSDISWFLLRMVWLGPIQSCVAEAKSFAVDPAISIYSRIAAIRALTATGTEEDFGECFDEIVSESTEIDRSLIAELVAHSTPSEMAISRVLAILPNAAQHERFSSDGLSSALVDFGDKLELDDLAKFIGGLAELLDEPPVIERRFCELSQRYSWLIKCAAAGVERLIREKHLAALDDAALSILTKIHLAYSYADIDLDQRNSDLPKLVPEWPELNRALFWYQAALTRKFLDEKKSERLTDFWDIAIFGRLWAFDEADFERVKQDVKEQELKDDKMVALTLAFQIYREAGRPRNWREQLKRLAAKDDELKDLLHKRLNPPARSAREREWKRQEAKWKRRDARRAAKEKKRHSDWAKALKKEIHLVRDTRHSQDGGVLNHHLYLFERLRELNDDNGKWTQSNWQDLIADQSQEVAEAFRDWAMAHWRIYTPKLRSEGVKDPNSVPYARILGLSGLAIEARYVSDWPKNLSDDEARQAFRYAVYELNGFTDWFEGLYTAFPGILAPMILGEIEWELQQELGDQEKLYVLHDLAHYAEPVASALANDILELLETYEPGTVDTLRYVLRLILASSVDEDSLAKVAKAKIAGGTAEGHLAQWYSVWVGAAPDAAIPSLRAYLKSLSDDAAVSFAMEFAGSLLGSHRALGPQRERFKTPEHLKELYLLMHAYIREEDDIHRAGTGVYSPGPRDDAQDARSSLFSLLLEHSGKRVFLALTEIAKLHPNEKSRTWMQHQIKSHAATEADEQAWTSDQLLEFEASLEKKPSNHRELHDLAVKRMEDLKDELEHGDSSIASLLQKEKEETEMRKYIGQWLRDRTDGKYSVSQEEELADAKKPDFRFLSSAFDAPVPMELKLADNKHWSGARLYERLENQLCGSYLRDAHSRRGIFALVYRGEKKSWILPSGKRANFDELIDRLRDHWQTLSPSFPDIDEIEIVGIDLSKRAAK